MQTYEISSDNVTTIFYVNDAFFFSCFLAQISTGIDSFYFLLIISISIKIILYTCLNQIKTSIYYNLCINYLKNF